MRSLELAMSQNPDGAPRVTGSVSLCHNLCESGGVLEAVAPRRRVAETGMPPVACDRRDDCMNIFCQDDDGSLWWSCRMSDGGDVYYPGILLAELQERVAQGEGVGDFMAFRGESGKIYFARRAEEGYEWLGQLPAAPAFIADAESELSFVATVPAVGFKRVQDDLRGGLDAENARRVGEALLTGIDDAMASARRSGYRVAPAMVRVAWRLWDGRLLHVSDAVRVSGAGATPGRERVFLSLAYSDKGFTGTEAGSVSVYGYRLRVVPAAPLPAAWRHVVKGVEIWVSREPECLRAGELPGAVLSVMQGSASRLACSYPARNIPEMEAELPDLPMSVQASAHEWVNAVSVGVDSESPEDLAMTGRRIPEGCGGHWGDSCDSLLGHGGFLHVAQGSVVRTSVRGNPLVPGSETGDVGDRVLHMWPQLTGGGAFTRQYIYLATGRGLVALTHDAEGVHTNCRMVWPVAVGGYRQGVATDAGLFVRTLAGEILRVRDSRCEVMLRRVEGMEGMAWSGCRGWLMLMGKERSLVLQADAGWRAFTCDMVWRPLQGCRWRRLGWYEQRRGRVLFYDLDAGEDADKSAGCVYSLRLASPPEATRMPRLWIGAEGMPLNAQVVVRCGIGSSRTELLRAGLQGPCEDGVSLDVLVPRGAPGRGLDYELSIAGVCGRVREVCWLRDRSIVK